MPGDYSRFSDAPRKRFAKLLMQQGKVQLDADWNELVDILGRRDQLQSLDTFGKARAMSPTAFKIGVSGSDLTIGAGRLYAGGRLAEVFDGETPTYDHQPYYVPNAPGETPLEPPPLADLAPGQHLVYLDVSEREITYVEDPELLEVALGDVDTSTRSQTVWQVKTKPNLPCDADLDAAFPRSNATLSVRVNLPPDQPDPCVLPDVGGFLDVENRHYRVEVHGTNRIKFARDPVVSPIEAMRPGAPGQTILTVRRIGRDPVLRFDVNNYVEVVNERHVLHGKPGIYARILAIDPAVREITIDAAVAAEDVLPARRPRLIRWEKDLIAIPANNIQLEAGIEIDVKGSNFHNGDYWYFPARAATRTAGPLTDAPPRGILHSYAALATIQVGSAKNVSLLSDCRRLWPEECDCDCQVCVTPESQLSGTMTIQKAIDKLRAKDGGTICLTPGIYELDHGVVLRGAKFIRITGHGLANLQYSGNEQHAILIERSANITIEDVRIERAGSLEGGREAAAIVIRNCSEDVTVQRCEIVVSEITDAPRGIAVALDNAALDVNVLDCDLYASNGVSVFEERGFSLFLGYGIRVRGCIINASLEGVKLLARSLGSIEARGNHIVAGEAGVRLESGFSIGLGILIDGNFISSGRSGISISADAANVTNNHLVGDFDFDANAEKLTPAHLTDSGIAFYCDEYDSIESCLATGNHISGFLGAGILVAGHVDGLLAKMNFIARTAAGGIVVMDKAQGSRVVFENNELRDVAQGDDRAAHAWHGIRIAAQCDAAIIGNIIENVGLKPKGARPLQKANGIFCNAPKLVRIHQNRIRGVVASVQFEVTPQFRDRDVVTGRGENERIFTTGVPTTTGNGDLTAISSFASAAIELAPRFGVATITENVVHAEGFEEDTRGLAHCYALRVRAAAAPGFRFVALGRGQGLLLWDQLPFAVAMPADSARLLVRANDLECSGMMNRGLGIVEVVDAPQLNCTFGGNMCVSRRVVFNNAVFLAAETVVADSNQILGGHEVALVIQCTQGRWTVLGNIAESRIQVNGNEFQTSDYAKLNRF